ncbi:MAG: histidinol-phosphatase HisJ family protein [Anaerolineales bacterium]|jgi:histidinol-phosphatase (PHP family)
MTAMIPMDYHIHSEHSCDCEESMEVMARASVAQGVRRMGFSDHFDRNPLDHGFDYLQPEAWWESFRSCQLLFTDTLSIQAGVEIGEPHRYPEDTRALLERYPWDFVLGSLHWVDGQVVFGSEYFERSPDEAYTKYFQEMQRMVSEGEFDILAHMDVVKRYGYENYGSFDPQRYEKDIRAVLKTLSERGMAMEVNTSTLRRPVGETSPGITILRWFYEEGGKHVTMGSDAHHTEHVGYGLQRSMSNLQQAGFTRLTAYKRRSPHPFEFEAGPTHDNR